MNTGHLQYFLLNHWGSFQNLSFREHNIHPSQSTQYERLLNDEQCAACVQFLDVIKKKHVTIAWELKNPGFCFAQRYQLFVCMSVCLLRSNNIGGHGHWYKHNSTCANKDRKASRPRLIHSLVDAKKSQENWQFFFNAIPNGFFVVELQDLIFAQTIANT